jgi:hypothetical protein
MIAPVDDVELMQMLQSQQELCTVEPTSFLVEALLPLKVVEQLSSIDKAVIGCNRLNRNKPSGTTNSRQDQIQFLLRLETEFQRHDERVVHACKHQTLGKGVRDFVPVHNVCFSNGFESVNTGGVAFPNLEDLRIRLSDACSALRDRGNSPCRSFLFR